MSAGYEFDTTTLRFTYSSMTTPAAGLRLRHGDARAHAAQDARRCRAATTPPTTSRAGCWRPAPDGETVPVSLLYRKGTPLDGSAPLFLYGYGAYGIAIPAVVLDHAAVARRPRLRLRHRPHPRRQGQGLSLVHGRQAREEAQHLHRLHRRRRVSWSKQGYTQPRPHRRQRRLGRRHADGRRRQHGARPVPRHHRRRAVRRRAQHHAGREPAADAARVARVGQPDHQSKEDFEIIRSYSPYENVDGQGLSAHLRLRRAHRSARHLLGAGQVDRAAARSSTPATT